MIKSYNIENNMDKTVPQNYKIVRLNSQLFPIHPLEAELYKLYDLNPIEIEVNNTEELLLRYIDVDVLINVNTHLSGELIANLNKCIYISHLGIGSDKTDIDMATKYGIVVSNDPYFCVEDVADHTLSLLLSLARKLPEMTTFMKLGKFGKARKIAINSERLSSSVIGLVGFGSIGRAVAKRAHAFGMRILATDIYMDSMAHVAKELCVELVDFNYLISNSDYVSLHVPLTNETYHLVNSAVLDKMKPSACLINTARGAIVDEIALANTLKEGWLAGAGIDTYELINVHQDNISNPSHPYIDLDNVILSPHIAGLSTQSMETWARIGVENLVSIVNNCWPHPNNIVNKGVVPRISLNKYDETIFKHRPVGQTKNEII